jgi:signal transduction histidine kinase
MNISYGAIYLFDEDEDKFILKADRSFKGVEPSVHALDADNDLIKFIKFRGKGFMYEDLQKLISQKVNNKINDKANDKENRKKQCDADLSKALTQMEQLKAKVVIPHFIKDELIGFLVLGEKVSLMPYSDADTSKLTTLSSSAGLAITNAISMLKLRDRERDLAAKGRVIDIGNLASATEHQVGNILNTIIWGVFGVKSDKAITELLQQKPEALAAFKKKLDEITTNAQSGRNIIKEIRDYSQQDKSKEHVLVNLKEVTGKAKSMFYMDINKLPQIDISILGADDVPAVLGSPVGLQQVFINLFNNGYDSTQEMKQHIQEHPELGISDYKGRIEVTMRRVKGKVEIHVIDNGKGITEEVAKKLFGPLFTTKGSLEKREEMNLNGGTGIGLYIMRRIILDHEGTIALFRTEPLKGADFIIELPVP